jgi:DNA (cytosine-5)-methyltransferase 1
MSVNEKGILSFSSVAIAGSRWDHPALPHPTLNTDSPGHSDQELFSQRGAGLVGAMRESGPGYWIESDVAGTLDANMGMSGHANRPAVIGFQSNLGSRGGDVFEEVSPTVRIGSQSSGSSGNPPAVATARLVAFGEYVEDGTSSTVQRRDYKSATDLVVEPTVQGGASICSETPPADFAPQVFVKATNPRSPDDAPRFEEASVAACLNGWDERHQPPKHLVAEGQFLQPTPNKQDTQPAVSFYPNMGPLARTDGARVELSGTLAGADGGNKMAVAHAYHVRRLTPTECERLQGFPDGYTNIPMPQKKGEPKPAPDGARYKALGNSMAVPVMRWIGERIAMVDRLAGGEER